MLKATKMMEMTNDFVLLKELPKEEQTKGGIIVTLDKWGRRCKVISTPKECQVSIGDIVLRNVGKGTSIELDGVEFEILHTNWLIAVSD